MDIHPKETLPPNGLWRWKWFTLLMYSPPSWMGEEAVVEGEEAVVEEEEEEEEEEE